MGFVLHDDPQSRRVWMVSERSSPRVMARGSGDPETRMSFRFPGGDFEVTYMQQAPEEGDIVFRRGRPWMVASAEREDGTTLIRLQEAEEDARG
jgi:hypothetical protein